VPPSRSTPRALVRRSASFVLPLLDRFGPSRASAVPGTNDLLVRDVGLSRSMASAASGGHSQMRDRSGGESKQTGGSTADR
jgi:hypothetical protein